MEEGEAKRTYLELKNLTLGEARRCLKVSTPDLGFYYNKAITRAGNLASDKDKDPTLRGSSHRDGSQIRVIMNVFSEDISENVDSVRNEFRAWPRLCGHHRKWMTAAHSA